MKNLKNYSNQFVFVCYDPGAGGESTSIKISSLESCDQLTGYITAESRTIITNEFFKKTFLNIAGVFDEKVRLAQKIFQESPVPKKIQIVPSHWDYSSYVQHPEFTHSRFLRILSPSKEMLKNNVDKKIYNSKFKNFLEFKGFCLTLIDTDALAELLQQKKINMQMTIGEIQQELFNVPNSARYPKIDSFHTIIENSSILNIAYDSFAQNESTIKSFINRN